MYIDFSIFVNIDIYQLKIFLIIKNLFIIFRKEDMKILENPDLENHFHFYNGKIHFP